MSHTARRPSSGPPPSASRSILPVEASRFADTLDEAIELASSYAEDAKVLVVSPMFPLPLSDRERILPFSRTLARSGMSTTLLRYLF